MDPYRPGHYAPYRAPSYERPPFAPPGGPPSYGHSSRGGYTPGGPTQRPGYIGPRQGYGPGNMPVGGAPPMAAPGSEVERLTTLFIGGISPGVTDDWMEKILKTCGTLKSWKRVKDQSGNPKGFGFAEYADADSVLRALRVLGGEGSGDEKKDKGVVLPALEEGANGKKLIVKADENTRKYLDQYEASRPRTVHDTELDKNALLSVIIVVEDMTKPQDRRDLSPSQENKLSRTSPTPEVKTEHGEKDDDTDLPADLPPDQKDLIYREIAFFRERAAARERERQREEEERASRRAKAEKERERSHGRENRERERERERERDRDRDRDRQYGHYHQSVNFVPARDSRRESYVLDDEEEEQRRQAKRKTEMEMAFKERERRWQHREETMATNREREAERDLDIREKQIRDREIMARKLAEWDDDAEAERGQEEYYRDRSRWWFHRQQFRARELAMDESDRLREQQEIESEQHRLRMLEEERKQRAEAIEAELNNEKEISILATNGTSQNNNVKAKLTLNLSSKRRAALMTSTEDEEFDDDEGIESKRKRRVLVPLEYSDNEDDEKKTEERKKKIKELVATIPTDKEAIWNWNVKWEELDENILSKKLQPFVNKKIVEYLGVQEDELVSFVIDHLRNKKPAADLIKEMEMTLDEESELFVMKLWRMLIFETESKTRKI
ncbi:hypothetical protein C1645_793674 [Glomus cerebriforme]|uniref:PWI domain-containing protein n=1 Tax=Glomus cerebriforme TaxID=658196 RepID=A0A397S560_9GLOM|nr:hypothetical protein C1645_793674 [Glomus cerebriforme]